MNPNYRAVASIYDHLMKSIDYKEWSEYLQDILIERDCKFTSALEFGAGTCKISENLSRKFTLFVATDLSLDMLLENKIQHNFVKVCCDMKKSSFNKKFEVLIAAFDTINYMLNRTELTDFFVNVKSLMNKNSVFLFDASLEKDSLKNTKRLNRKGKVGELAYTQKSFYDKENKIHYNNFEIISSNSVFEEKHVQKIFPLEQYFESIEDAGLVVLDCFDCFSFEDVDHQSERAQFVVGK
ncbi:MAG: hypothetical protein PHW27_08900 [Melioribacteraceae bacterium]|nr:hypothetical protein [Melioribacteraceae bacterium]